MLGESSDGSLTPTVTIEVNLTWGLAWSFNGKTGIFRSSEVFIDNIDRKKVFVLKSEISTYSPW
jgi:hypothetical protein